MQLVYVYLPRYLRFNRYMVEGERDYICLLQQTRTVLIDTWWNVNEKCKKYFCFIMDVLIDTWWNVNLDEIMLRLAHDTVLIDTWWNVNITETTIISTITKF